MTEITQAMVDRARAATPELDEAEVRRTLVAALKPVVYRAHADTRIAYRRVSKSVSLDGKYHRYHDDLRFPGSRKKDRRGGVETGNRAIVPDAAKPTQAMLGAGVLPHDGREFGALFHVRQCLKMAEAYRAMAALNPDIAVSSEMIQAGVTAQTDFANRTCNTFTCPDYVGIYRAMRKLEPTP